MRYDFIEIGTSDFRTLSQSTTGIGIAVEPVAFYLDRIPDREGLTKVNAAVSDMEKIVDVYYCDLDTIIDYNFPNWLRGCNSIDKPHPTVEHFCSASKLLIEKLVKRTQAICITLQTLFSEHHVDEVGILKIDTEGHDYTIVKSFLQMKEKPLIKKIQFEANTLLAEDKKEELVAMAKEQGYKVYPLTDKQYSDLIFEP